MGILSYTFKYTKSSVSIIIKIIDCYIRYVFIYLHIKCSMSIIIITIIKIITQTIDGYIRYVIIYLYIKRCVSIIIIKITIKIIDCYVRYVFIYLYIKTSMSIIIKNKISRANKTTMYDIFHIPYIK